jgi:hypothetical protein
MLARFLDIASRTARRVKSCEATEARSSSPRAGVVTGMPSSRMTSKGIRVRWIAMPGIARGPRIGIVTSIGRLSSSSITRQSAQQAWWLSAAPGPHAFTAARQRPRHVRPSCPQA